MIKHECERRSDTSSGVERETSMRKLTKTTTPSYTRELLSKSVKNHSGGVARGRKQNIDTKSKRLARPYVIFERDVIYSSDYFNKGGQTTRIL